MEFDHPLEFLNEVEIQKERYKNHRMYILVKEEYPASVAINSAAHGAMGAYKAWSGEAEFDGWCTYSYRKITCTVNPKELEQINALVEKLGIKKLEQTESRLDRAHILTVIYPFDATLHKFKAFKFLRLYK